MKYIILATRWKAWSTLITLVASLIITRQISTTIAFVLVDILIKIPAHAYWLKKRT